MLFFVITTLIFDTSCKKQDLSIGKTNFSQSQTFNVSNIPYAQDQELSLIANNQDYVHYEIARKLALIDLEMNVKESMNWDGAKLSEKPVVIYNSKSEAKYYEFIVLNESGSGMGTLTTCAKKETDANISNVLPYVRNYANVLTKGTGYKIISGGYPKTLYTGLIGKSGDDATVIIDPTTGNTVTNVISEDAQGMVDAIKNLSPEELNKLNVNDPNQLISQIVEKDNQNKIYAEKYWNVIDSLKNQLDTMTDNQIVTALTSKGTSTWTSYSEYILSNYSQNKNLGLTFWSGWCGPSALAFIYRGLYDNYNDFKLPIHGDSDFGKLPLQFNNINYSYYNYNDSGDDDKDGISNDTDKDWIDKQSLINDGGLYAKLATYSGLYLLPNIVKPILGGNTASKNAPTFPGPMNLALISATKGKYGLSYVFDAHDHMRSTNLPAICLVENMSHWVVSIGSKYEYWNWQVVMKIFKKSFILSEGAVRTNKWLYIQDNGYTSGTENGFRPYWRNDKLTFYIEYGVQKS